MTFSVCRMLSVADFSSTQTYCSEVGENSTTQISVGTDLKRRIDVFI